MGSSNTDGRRQDKEILMKSHLQKKTQIVKPLEHRAQTSFMFLEAEV